MFFKRTPITADQVNEQMIDTWRQKHPEGVFEITIGDRKAFIRMSTNREIKEMFAMVVKGGDPLQVSLDRVKKAWLAGDDEIINDPAHYKELTDQWSGIIREKVNRLVPGAYGVSM